MIKKCFLGIFLGLMAQFSYSQIIRLGAFVNPVISWMRSDNSYVASNGQHVGIAFGLIFDKFFAPHYAFASGISIQNMGGIINYVKGKSLLTSEGTKTIAAGNDVVYKLQYIHVPFGIKLRSEHIGYSTYFVELGLDPMVNVGALADVNSLSVTNVGVSDEINLFYMAYHLSAGLEYKIVGNTSVLAGLTYMNGFTNITDDAPAKVVMNGVELRIGLMF